MRDLWPIRTDRRGGNSGHWIRVAIKDKWKGKGREGNSRSEATKSEAR